MTRHLPCTSHVIAGLDSSDVSAALAQAHRLTPCADLLGTRTQTYLDTLKALGAYDLSAARALEPHLDALTIMREAGVQPADVSAQLSHLTPVASGRDDNTFDAWGVYASSAPGLRATKGEASWILNGTKSWCSLANVLNQALITAGTDEGQRLFAVNLRADGVSFDDAPWVSRGLAGIRSTSVSFDAVPVVAIGEPGFYLGRPGFAAGGVAVAAIWAGGAAALAASLTQAAERREPDQIALMHLGQVHVDVQVMEMALADAARQIDDGSAQGEAGALMAATVRAIVAERVESILRTVGHALGPGPLTSNEEHARRVADLSVYVRQHHAERDLAALGELSRQHGPGASNEVAEQ